MRLLRSVLTAVFFAVFGAGCFILGAPVVPIVSIFSRKKALGYIRALWRLFLAWLEFFRLIKIDKTGVNPEKSGRVIAANHPTLLDIVILISIYKNSVCLVKKSLLRNILLYPIIRSVFIVSEKFEMSVIEDAANAVRQGLNVIIFPEGTRSDNPEKKIRRGAARIAMRAGCPVVPVRISCSPQILGKLDNPLSVSDKTVRFLVEELAEIPPDESIDLNNSKKSRLLTGKIANVLNLK